MKIIYTWRHTQTMRLEGNMMKALNKVVKSVVSTGTILAALTLTPSTLANEGYSTEGKNHIIGLKTSIGAMDINQRHEESDLQFSVSPYYHYQLDQNWSFTLSYINGEADDSLEIFDDILVEDHFEYSAVAAGAKAHMPLSNRWSLYGHLALHHYESEQYIEHFDDRRQDGVSYFGAVGAEFRAYNGFGVGFEYHVLDMDEISVKAVGISVSYMF